MTPRARQVVLALLALLLLGLVAGAWLYAFQRVERWQALPPQGEAAYNPLYALKATLRADGVAVASRARLDLAAAPPGPDDALVLLGDIRALAPREADALLAAVARGAHLVVAAPAANGPAAPAFGPLGERLGVGAAPGQRQCLRLHSGQGTVSDFCGDVRLRLRPGTTPLASWRDPQAGLVFVRIGHGLGSVDVVSSLGFLANARLREPAHLALARQLLAPHYGAGTVQLVYAANMPPLWRWLLAHGWRVLLPLLLALAAWLWMRAQRFGPPLPPRPQARRALVEHVQASGEHLYRYGRDALLHQAMRDAVLARLRRRDPLAAALAGDAQAQAVAARTGLPVAGVRDTLQPHPPANGPELLARISRLIALRNRL
ncbi:MAG: DUF4350 domain-containing protein [Lysobacteraceae bacterium]